MSLSLLATTTTTIYSATAENPLRRKNSRLPRAQVRNRAAYTSCDQNQRKEGEKVHVTDRRNVLLGMGGLYGATATIGSQGRMAIGAPVQPPDLSACHLAVDAATSKEVPCCPPYTSADIIDFVPPSPKEPLRVRKSVRKYAEDLEKFKAAIAEMKKLKPDDPWNYMQQATIHCTYCNGAYNQVGTNPPVILQVHGSWLFLPWHRYYLYFWERILGKLIGDPTFALPFWDWDTPEGMNMPKIYLDKSSPLYDDNRDHNHYDALLDYQYSFGQPNPTPDQEKDVIMNNLRYLYNMFKEGVPCPSLFMGKPIVAGEAVPSQAAGSLENLHNVHHMWTGPSVTPYYDMGNFYTAARDTIFFGHHANVDRMWDVYHSLRGGKIEFKDDDWLETSFIFYDENRKVVKCKVKDCLDPHDLGYTYKTEKLEWPDSRKTYMKKKKANKKMEKVGKYSLIQVEEFGKDPKVLNKTIRVLVRRPKISRSKDEKEDAIEVLYIDDIVLDHVEPARFDVYISKPIEDKFATEDLGELAGSYVKVPHAHHKKSSITSIKYDIKLGITLLVEDIDADASENLVVSFVPRRGEVTIGGVTIELCNSD